MRKLVYLLIAAAALIAACYFGMSYFKSSPVMPTYFAYNSNAINSFKSFSSKEVIDLDALEKWDQVMFELVKSNKLGDAYAGRVYAYLYTAQYEVAALSFNETQSFSGSIDPISAQVLCLFFTDSCSNLVRQGNTDVYSNVLANIVIEKIKQRIAEDKKSTYLYPVAESKEGWVGVKPYFGQEVGSWRTWYIKSSSTFRATPPPPPQSPEWDKELQDVKQQLQAITPEQVKSVVIWAGGGGTITPPGQWLRLANQYMTEKNVPLSKILTVRAVLARGIEDAVISVFDSKYTYLCKRPFMRDSKILTVMPTPNHPSYPAGHATISWSAATILDFYFPENKSEWDRMATDASHGRTWGGIHFPIDSEVGKAMGIKVGDVVISGMEKGHS